MKPEAIPESPTQLALSSQRMGTCHLPLALGICSKGHLWASYASLLISVALSPVRSRNLLIYEEHAPLEESSSPASTGELGGWDRGSSLLRASGLEALPEVDLRHFIISNETSLEKSVLLALQQHL